MQLQGKVSKVDGEWSSHRITVNIKGEYQGLEWTLQHIDNRELKLGIGQEVEVSVQLRVLEVPEVEDYSSFCARMDEQNKQETEALS